MIYNLEELRKAYNAGKTFKYVFFWGHTPPKDGGVDKRLLQSMVDVPVHGRGDGVFLRGAVYDGREGKAVR